MIKYYNFGAEGRKRIKKAAKTIKELDTRQKGFTGEAVEFRNRIKAVLHDPRREWSLEYRGVCSNSKWKSYTRGYYVTWVCENAFRDKRGKDRLATILFHEMVHACGGEELDAETLEKKYFDGRGATDPDKDDFEEFKRRGDTGRWFVLLRDRRRRLAYVYRKNGSHGETSVTEFKLLSKKKGANPRGRTKGTSAETVP